MRRLDLADLVAIAAELTEIETPKLLEILATGALAALMAEAGRALLRVLRPGALSQLLGRRRQRLLWHLSRPGVGRRPP